MKIHGGAGLVTDRPPRGSKKKMVMKRGEGGGGQKRRQQGDSNCFWIKHYAGTVEYHADGFLDKNRDAVPEALAEVVRSSGTTFVARLFPSEDSGGGDRGRGGRGGRSKKKSKVSLLSLFRSSLSSLIKALQASSPHYVRCIKPNSLHAPKVFHAGLVNRQLR